MPSSILDSGHPSLNINSDVDGVQQFFVGTDDTNGFAGSLEELTEFYTDSDGIIQNRIDSSYLH